VGELNGPGNGPGNGKERAPVALSFVDRIVFGLSMAAAVLGAGVVLLMVAVVGYSVVLRYFFGTPVTWSDELSGYLVVALVMLGAAEALRRGDHIGVDLLTAKAKGGLSRALDVWGNVAVIAVAVTLLVSGVEMIAYSVDFGILSEGYMEVPMWIPQSFILLGAGLLLLMALARILRLLKGHDTS